MQAITFRRGLVGVATAALTAAGLSAAAPASAVISNTYVYADADVHNDGGDCDVSPTGSSPASLPFTDNGVPVTRSYSETATITHNVDPTDVTSLAASAVMTASATPIGAGAATIKMSGSAKATATPELAASACDSHANADADSYADFTLPAPMWATVTVKSVSNGASFSVEIGGPDGGVGLGGTGKSSGSVTALIPAGPVSVWSGIEADAYGGPDEDRSEAVTGSATIKLAPVGSPSAVAMQGKAKGLLVLGARNCATGNVDASLTKKAKKKAKSVTVTVNGKTAAKFKGKKLKKRAFAVGAAPASAANVVAKIKLKNGKKARISRSYLACS